MIWIFRLFNWKVCVIVMGVLIIGPLIFIPPSIWTEVFWRFWNETPIVYWLGQLGYVFFFAALVTLFYGFLVAVFG